MYDMYVHGPVPSRRGIRLKTRRGDEEVYHITLGVEPGNDGI